MSWWTTHVVPRIVDVACGQRQTAELRTRVCAGLTGRVVEIGFGSGHNVAHYPAAVSRVDAVEPADLGWRLAGRRLAAATVPVERSGLDGQRLPFADEEFDSALSTWTLCTIPDPVAALREVIRVLKPGASLHLVEHGLAPTAAVQRWQHRLEPVQKRVAGGCHLARPIRQLLDEAGFQVTAWDEFYEQGAPKPLGALSLGTARRS